MSGILKHLAGVQVVVTGTKTRKILVPPSKQTAFREILSMAGLGFEAYTWFQRPPAGRDECLPKRS